ncbi:SPOR domain-containing protein [Aestuariivirga sp.]|uniref:SPOR domain-containing protein n=1 Tax=Aestuariivirga sp. TaxID=2650926 RepID=UPI00391C5882
MKVRTLILASVCSALLAAGATPSLAAAGNPASSLASQAYKALHAGDPASAVIAYTQAIESRTLEPEVLANALLNRGLAYQRLNEHEFALDDYTAALRIDAMSGKLRALALYNRGLSYQRLDRDALAMEDYTSALFLDGQFSHAYYSRGTLLRDGGQYLFALADFDKALRFGYPDAARLHFAQSLTFEKLNRAEDARNALNQALAANPKYEPALQRLAVLDGTMPQAPAEASDQMQTAAVTRAGVNLPQAAAPGATLLGSEAQAGENDISPSAEKEFTDRVPPEEVTQVAAVQPSPAAPAEEKILAVEEVPEEAPATVAVAEPASAPVEGVAQEPAEAPKASGWAVQLASATTEEAAWSTWKKMKARHKALSSHEPVVVRADLGSKGVFYRVRLVGYDTQTDAGKTCSRLKAKGVKCYVSKSSS